MNEDSIQNNAPDANWQNEPIFNEAEKQAYASTESMGVPIAPLPTIEWSASEYIAHEKTASWYAVLFASGIVVTLITFIITRDILSSIVILMSLAAIAVYAGRKPATKNFSVGESGVLVGDKPYSYAEFRSFSVVEEGAIDSIWLKSVKRYAPPVVMYFSPEEEEDIINILSNFLPHEERELDRVDRLSKRIRF